MDCSPATLNGLRTSSVILGSPLSYVRYGRWTFTEPGEGDWGVGGGDRLRIADINICRAISQIEVYSVSCILPCHELHPVADIRVAKQ